MISNIFIGFLLVSFLWEVKWLKCAIMRNGEPMSLEVSDKNSAASMLYKEYLKTPKKSRCALAKCRNYHKQAAYKNRNDNALLKDPRRKLTKDLQRLVKPTLEEVLKKSPDFNKKPMFYKVTYCTEVITTPLPRLIRPRKFKKYSSTQLHNPKKYKDVNKKNMSKVKQVSNLKHIVEKYESLFRGLGCEKDKCHITINEHSDTDDVPRKLTVALKNDFKNEIDYMEKLGIITKDPSPKSWVIYLPATRNKMTESDKIYEKLVLGYADDVISSLTTENLGTKVAETPLQFSETPGVEIAETPLQIDESPLQIAESPLQMTETPLKISETPYEKTLPPDVPVDNTDINLQHNNNTSEENKSTVKPSTTQRELDRIETLVHGDADEYVLSTLTSENSGVNMSEVPYEKMLPADIPADDAVDGGDLPMYEMESFYRDISLNDHLNWVQPQPVFLKYDRHKKDPVTEEPKPTRITISKVPIDSRSPSLRELTVSRIITMLDDIPDSTTTERSEAQRSFLFYHSKKRRH